MTANLTSAIGAYTNAARGGAGIEPRPQEAGQSFSDLVQSVAEGALQSGFRAEAVTLEAIDGSAEVSQVVTSSHCRLSWRCAIRSLRPIRKFSVCRSDDRIFRPHPRQKATRWIPPPFSTFRVKP